MTSLDLSAIYMSTRMRSMSEETDFSSVTLDESPIEFVLIGPHRSRDKVLVRSKNAGLDLLGVAADKELEYKLREAQPSGSSLFQLPFFGKSRVLNVVESSRSEDLDPEFDSRRSAYRFAWVGEATTLRKHDVERSLTKSIPGIRDALKAGNHPDLELAIAPVILQCTIADQRLRRRRQLMYGVLISYLGAIATVCVFWLIQKAFPKL
jgi:hypothetical protein